MIKRFAIALFVLTSVPLAARAITPDQIASASRMYNGQHVDVTGRVMHVRARRLPSGAAYERFSLCATRCIQAVVSGVPALTEGQTITLHGTFYTWKNLGGYLLIRGVEVDAGSL
ncbi:MAG TPA: hypothetical protein VMF11_02170 [Candidatus Baltobacteraceae bacterium]|nr:hypothetical protein [Candidatus Baltobacteraceae bacterium]